MASTGDGAGASPSFKGAAPPHSVEIIAIKRAKGIVPETERWFYQVLDDLGTNRHVGPYSISASRFLASSDF